MSASWIQMINGSPKNLHFSYLLCVKMDINVRLHITGEDIMACLEYAAFLADEEVGVAA